MIVKQLDFTTVSPLLGWTQEGGRLEKWSRVNWEEDEEASLFFLPIFSTRLPVNFHDYFSAPTPLWRFSKKLWYFRHKKWIERSILMILCGGEISIDWDSDDASSWKTISSAPASTVDYWTQKLPYAEGKSILQDQVKSASFIEVF